MSLEPPFPLEFLVPGTPVSLQANRRESLDQWKANIRDASRGALPEGHFASQAPVAVTLYYFPDTEMVGDIDNIIKPTLDALCHHVYVDDRQVERVLVQKFEPNRIFPFRSPSLALDAAILGAKPLLYVRISDDPFEELE